MKKISNILFWGVIALVLTLSSCSESDLLSNSDSDFSNLKFKVNVNTANTSRAASDNKTNWTTGDQIYVAVDANKNSMCLLEYDGTDWNVKKITDEVTFGDSGRLNAVFSDKLTYDASSITTFGDVLYTTDGTYTKEDNVVLINLNMDKRPVAKIKVNGMPSGYYIDGLQEYTNLDISNMVWADTHSQGKLCSESEGGDNYTFYGTLNPNPRTRDGGIYTSYSTLIRLVNGKGAYYEKTFTGENLQSGDCITISGPKISNDWTAMIPIDGITSKGDVNLMIDGTDKITNHYTLSPIDATQTACEYTSSDNNIVTVDNDGNIKAISRGQATITVKSKESNVSCNINVSVKDLTDLITAKSLGMSGVSINGHIQSNSTFSWYFSNGSPVNVKLISLQLVDGSTGNAGNEMNVNVDVNAGSAVSYSTTIGFLGINEPVTCRFKYEYNSKTYVVTAVCN